MFDATQIIIILLVISILLSYNNMEWGSLYVSILNRWLRWIVFSLMMAALSTKFGWTGRPFLSIAIIAFLAWFLLESIYTWIMVSALSRSPIPLFPKFQANSKGDEWPAQRKFIAIRDWLRNNGYKKLESVKAENEDSIRSTIYQDEQGIVRLQVLFFLQRAGNVTVCYLLSSKSVNGDYYLTDNVFHPFGGFYPENWDIVRKPLVRSLERIVRIHRRRLKGQELFLWSDENALDDINRQQHMLEQINLQSGFLIPHHQQEEFGRLTKEGRYRIWKEILLLNYFGITVGY